MGKGYGQRALTPLFKHEDVLLQKSLALCKFFKFFQCFQVFLRGPPHEGGVK
jgi:hypothetical protein